MYEGPLPQRPKRSRTDVLRELAFGLQLPSQHQLKAKQLTLSAAQREALGRELVDHYFGGNQPYLASPEGATDYFDHLIDRVTDNRRRVIPWLRSVTPLEGLRVLEIGSGTGSSAVAFAEQGAHLVGVDIDAPSLSVAQRRCELYNLKRVELVHANISDSHPVFSQRYDLIIFFASLEHMLHEERVEGLRKTWSMLATGGLLSVVECPNRLWYFDEHTAQLPFFHWLPDALALDYAVRSPRASLRAEVNRADLGSFLRRGRGVSFHEFELALGEHDAGRVASELEEFLQRTYPVFRVRDQLSLARDYHRLLHRIAPNVHPGYLRPSLNIVLRKP